MILGKIPAFPVELPPLIAPYKGGETENLVPSPGGLGWGKTQICKLLQTCHRSLALSGLSHKGREPLYLLTALFR